jgi:predicted RNA polymerase sigma factor
LYNVLARAAPGPVVDVNRAVAHGRAFGPGAGLAVLREMDTESLGDSPLVPSVYGDLLERAGLYSQAGVAFTEAASRSANARERSVLQRRADRNRSRGPDTDESPQPARA